MNDLPDNELLSAYLDGELTAAERQQVEQSLAANPAARQLLEELRAVSSAVHALPREKLGEDLAPRVLRLAERRMLTGEQPDPASVEDAPMPLGRSLIRRFTRPRILVWLAITAVFAIMIRINEQRDAERVASAPRKIAMAPDTPRSPLPPSSIRAYPSAKTESERLATKSAPAASPMPADAKPADVPKASQIAASRDKGGPPAEKSPAAAIAGQAQDEKSGRSLAEQEDLNRMKGKGAAKDNENDKYRASPKQQEPDEAVMVVNCDVSPEAVKKQAFDRLLTSNGIVWQQAGVAEDRSRSVALPSPQPDASPESSYMRKDAAAKSSSVAKTDKPAVAAPALVGQKAEETKNKSPSERQMQQQSVVAARNVQSPSAGSGGEALDVVYVEATPAQIEATLKSLAAQPEAFPSLYVQPAAGERSQQAFSQYNRLAGSKPAAGSAIGGPGAAANRSTSLFLKSAEYKTNARDYGPTQKGGERAEIHGAAVLSKEGKAAEAASSQSALRRAMQATPQNQTSSPAFAQRVTINANAGQQLADQLGVAINAARPAKQGPERAEGLANEALQETDRAALQYNAPNQRAKQNAPTQRVLFVLRVQAPAVSPATSPTGPVASPAKAAEPAVTAPKR